MIRSLTLFPLLTFFSGIALSQNVIQQAGPFVWDDGCGQQLQISITVRSNVDGYPGLYVWDYEVDNISVQSPYSDGAVNGVGEFDLSFPEALPDLGNITVGPNWTSNVWVNYDATTSLLTGSNGGTDPNPLTTGTPQPIYAIRPGQSMHVTFTTLPRNVLDVPGCSSDSPSSCAQAVKAITAITAQWRHTL